MVTHIFFRYSLRVQAMVPLASLVGESDKEFDVDCCKIVDHRCWCGPAQSCPDLEGLLFWVQRVGNS